MERVIDSLHVAIPEPFRFDTQRCETCGATIEWSWT